MFCYRKKYLFNLPWTSEKVRANSTSKLHYIVLGKPEFTDALKPGFNKCWKKERFLNNWKERVINIDKVSFIK